MSEGENFEPDNSEEESLPIIRRLRRYLHLGPRTPTLLHAPKGNGLLSDKGLDPDADQGQLTKGSIEVSED